MVSVGVRGVRGVCSECGGKGKYKIYNAYDSKFEEEIICEYCDGRGVFSEPPVPRLPRDEGWVN